MVKIAVAQLDPHLADTAYNLDLIEHTLTDAARAGAELTVFPECAASGYLYESVDEALDVAEPIPGPVSTRIARVASRLDVYAVVGMLEQVNDLCYNSAILVGPAGIEAVYRKSHTLCLGVDRFTTPGDIPYQVHELPFGRIGILICYDLRFPEAARALALMGSQAILLPTNWPESSAIQPDVFTRARAAENRVFVFAANRVGVERGARFLGRSQIVGPDGGVVEEASRNREETLIRDIDLSEADRKHVIIRAGEHEMDTFGDRRPDQYGALVRQLLPT